MMTGAPPLLRGWTERKGDAAFAAADAAAAAKDAGSFSRATTSGSSSNSGVKSAYRPSSSSSSSTLSTMTPTILPSVSTLSSCPSSSSSPSSPSFSFSSSTSNELYLDPASKRPLRPSIRPASRRRTPRPSPLFLFHLLLLLPATLLLLLPPPTSAISRADFFPFGAHAGDVTLPTVDDSSSDEFPLSVPVTFFGNRFTSVFVNNNGHLSFETEIPNFAPDLNFPNQYQIIAPFMCDVDTRGTGSVTYRQTTDSALLAAVTKDVVDHFPDASDFRATAVFIATWDRVGYFRAKTDRVNTFQVALISDGTDTFAIFHYADNELRWFRGDGKSVVAGEEDAPAQAGFNSGPGSGPGRLFTLPNSGYPRVVELEKNSNFGQPGRWLFHLSHNRGMEVRGVESAGGSGSLGGGARVSPESGSCREAPSDVCHTNARCVDYNPGFCCRCQEPFFGNGRNCVERGAPQRVNGKVSGKVNGKTIDRVDLHSYVVTSDGRAYTAISRIGPDIGFHLQTLSTLGGVIGWLFAVAEDGAVNGYGFTGGAFNRTATVLFLPEYAVVRIRQRFHGSDVFNQLRMDTEINGKIPDHFSAGEKFSVDDYHEVYRRLSSGKLLSTSTRTYRVGDNAYKYVWNQTIEYDECAKGLTPADKAETRVSVSRNFVVYDANENIVRYAMTSSAAPNKGVDACADNKCSTSSTCIPEGDSYRCACNVGYEGDGTYCQDTDECINDIDDCHQNADCVNTEGSFLCQCKVGFRGDGRVSCTPSSTCRDLDCDPIKGRCVYDRKSGEPVCECLPGFVGDGSRGGCRRDDSGGGGDGSGDDCEALRCHAEAQCRYDADRRPVCVCRPGFVGDGQFCRAEDGGRGCEGVACGQNAACVEDGRGGGECRCHRGYVGDGVTCRPETTPRTCEALQCPAGTRCNYNSEGRPFCEAMQASCQELECDENARCIVQQIPGQEAALPRCICNEGFVGDGIRCRSQRRTCNEMRCDVNARCVESALGEPRCECGPGFVGNGFVCRRATCADLVCHADADCDADETSGAPRCQCREGFSGDGQTCSPSGADCSTLRNCDANAQCLYDADEAGFRCRCNYGYEGDGRVCRPIGTRYTCDVANNCDLNADCVLDETRNYQCRCKQGYHGDGYTCSLLSCREANICHDQAQCILDITAGSYACRCNDGYVGNGHDCRPRRPTSCLELDDCHPQAACLFDPSTGAHQCRCVPGFEGDGRDACLPVVADCRANPSSCDRNAACVAHGAGFVCRCNAGWRGDGRTCSSLTTPTTTPTRPPAPRGNLVYAHGMSLMKIPAGPSEDGGQQLLIKPGQTAIGVDVDCSERFVYWSDVSGKSIHRADYDGGSVSTIVSEGLGSPEGVAVDWIARNIYWTDSQLDRVEVARLDGSGRRVVVDTDLVNPRAIVVDAANGRLFWSDWNRAAPKVEAADLDGANRRVFLRDGLGLPNGLAVLHESNELCVADAKFERIECVDADDAGGRRVVFSEAAYPFAVTAAPGARLFWTDWEERGVQGVRVGDDENMAPLAAPLGGNGRLYGIAFMRDRCPRGSNGCAANNGGCSHFCFAKQDGSVKCGCPTGSTDCRED